MSARWPSHDAGCGEGDDRRPLSSGRPLGRDPRCRNDRHARAEWLRGGDAAITADVRRTYGVWGGVARPPRVSGMATAGWPRGRRGGTKSARACRGSFFAFAGELARTRPGEGVGSSRPRTRSPCGRGGRRRERGRGGGRGGVETPRRGRHSADVREQRRLRGQAAELLCAQGISSRTRPRRRGRRERASPAARPRNFRRPGRRPPRAEAAQTVAGHVAVEELMGHGDEGRSGGTSAAVVAVERAARRRRPPRTRPAHGRPVRCRAPTLQPLLRDGAGQGISRCLVRVADHHGAAARRQRRFIMVASRSLKINQNI